MHSTVGHASSITIFVYPDSCSARQIQVQAARREMLRRRRCILMLDLRPVVNKGRAAAVSQWLDGQRPYSSEELVLACEWIEKFPFDKRFGLRIHVVE